MATQSLKDFCLQNGVSAISNVRVNQNGLKYSTFIVGNEAVNIYFSTRASERVSESDTPKSFKDMLISHVEYSDGREARYKLSVGSDNFISTADLF